MEGREQSSQETAEQAALFGALADPTRLRLVKRLLRQCDQHALCVNALAELLGVSQSAVSQHLRVLKGMGLVRGERRGYHIHYFVNQDALERCRRLASEALSMQEPDLERLCSEHCPERRKQDVSSV
jgi:ArsR family transcriptional regulator, arsenate/arsenite/antimonite-responsive transcriptional repressor